MSQASNALSFVNQIRSLFADGSGTSDTWWQQLIRASGETDASSTFEHLFNAVAKEPGMAAILASVTDASRAHDSFVGRLLYVISHVSIWNVIQAVSHFMWSATTHSFNANASFALWASDVILFVLMYEKIGNALVGRNIATGTMQRARNVLHKAVNIVLGRPNEANAIPAYARVILALIAASVLLPALVSSFFVIVIPAVLFALGVKSGSIVGLGMVLLGIAHACMMRPLSWIVSPALMRALLYTYRFIGVATVLLLQPSASSAASEDRLNPGNPSILSSSSSAHSNSAPIQANIPNIGNDIFEPQRTASDNRHPLVDSSFGGSQPSYHLVH
jgi:hypothetical protein